jgi:hypothetical protein
MRVDEAGGPIERDGHLDRLVAPHACLLESAQLGESPREVGTADDRHGAGEPDVGPREAPGQGRDVGGEILDRRSIVAERIPRLGHVKHREDAQRQVL